MADRPVPEARPWSKSLHLGGPILVCNFHLWENVTEFLVLTANWLVPFVSLISSVDLPHFVEDGK